MEKLSELPPVRLFIWVWLNLVGFSRHCAQADTSIKLILVTPYSY
jgi:hypothetical protein